MKIEFAAQILLGTKRIVVVVVGGEEFAMTLRTRCQSRCLVHILQDGKIGPIHHAGYRLAHSKKSHSLEDIFDVANAHAAFGVLML